MVTCPSCAASLEARWKFCVYCGSQVIPAAIRPDAGQDAPQDASTGRRLSPVFILGMVFVGIGAALLVTFFALRG
jgi:hypothetical protein